MKSKWETDLVKVLFVCTGNICRSPTAEGVFRKVLTLYEHRPTTQGYKTPDSIYMLGKLNQHKNLNQRASYYYKEVIKRFPGSAAARNAERDLGSITQ